MYTRHRSLIHTITYPEMTFLSTDHFAFWIFSSSNTHHHLLWSPLFQYILSLSRALNTRFPTLTSVRTEFTLLNTYHLVSWIHIIQYISLRAMKSHYPIHVLIACLEYTFSNSHYRMPWIHITQYVILSCALTLPFPIHTVTRPEVTSLNIYLFRPSSALNLHFLIHLIACLEITFSYTLSLAFCTKFSTHRPRYKQTNTHYVFCLWCVSVRCVPVCTRFKCNFSYGIISN